MARLAGWMKALCATMILINPMAKFALTMEPVALNVRAKACALTGIPPIYLVRCALSLAADAESHVLPHASTTDVRNFERSVP